MQTLCRLILLLDSRERKAARLVQEEWRRWRQARATASASAAALAEAPATTPAAAAPRPRRRSSLDASALEQLRLITPRGESLVDGALKGIEALTPRRAACVARDGTPLMLPLPPTTLPTGQSRTRLSWSGYVNDDRADGNQSNCNPAIGRLSTRLSWSGYRCDGGEGDTVPATRGGDTVPATRGGDVGEPSALERHGGGMCGGRACLASGDGATARDGARLSYISTPSSTTAGDTASPLRVANGAVDDHGAVDDSRAIRTHARLSEASSGTVASTPGSVAAASLGEAVGGEISISSVSTPQAVDRLRLDLPVPPSERTPSAGGASSSSDCRRRPSSWLGKTVDRV